MLFGKESVQLLTLDSVAPGYVLKFKNPFLKIDTQGSEIDILKGSGKYLKKVKLLYLECPIVNINQGAPDISEYLTFTKKAGFIPLDICEKHIHNNILLQLDILFINKSEVFNLGLINKKHWSFNYL